MRAVMATAAKTVYSDITKDPEVCGGKACSACRFANSRSCISQYFPCSPAQLAACAAFNTTQHSICGYVSRTYWAQYGHW